MATRSLNKVMLIGNLTRDPELRYTPKGTAVCSFGLATNRSWMPTDGSERQEEVEFHRIVAWQKLAELCAQLLFKGRKAFLGGRLQTRTWTGKDNKERTTTEIVIDNMIVLDSKRREVEGRVSGQIVREVRVDDKSKSDKEPEKKAETKKVKTAEEPVKVKKEVKKEEVKADDIPF